MGCLNLTNANLKKTSYIIEQMFNWQSYIPKLIDEEYLRIFILILFDGKSMEPYHQLNFINYLEWVVHQNSNSSFRVNFWFPSFSWTSLHRFLIFTIVYGSFKIQEIPCFTILNLYHNKVIILQEHRYLWVYREYV